MFVLLIGALYLGADAAKDLPKLDQYKHALALGRQQEIVYLESQITPLDKAFRDTPNKHRRVRRDLLAQIKKYRERLEQLKNKNRLSVAQMPVLFQDRFRKGQLGQIVGTYEVSQVIDGTIALHRIDEGTFGERFHLKGYKTEGNIADGDKLDLKGTVYEVVGTESYTSVIGAVKTVFVLQPFDETPYRKYIVESDKKAEELEKDNSKPRTTKATPAKKLALAKLLLKKKPEAAKRRLKEIIKEHPDTPSAKEAKKLLDE